jgi:hypothetical protein
MILWDLKNNHVCSYKLVAEVVWTNIDMRKPTQREVQLKMKATCQRTQRILGRH